MFRYKDLKFLTIFMLLLGSSRSDIEYIPEDYTALDKTSYEENDGSNSLKHGKPLHKREGIGIRIPEWNGTFFLFRCNFFNKFLVYINSISFSTNRITIRAQKKKQYGISYYFWGFIRCTTANCPSICTSMKIKVLVCTAGACNQKVHYVGLDLG